jgi:Glycosyl transferases group 1
MTAPPGLSQVVSICLVGQHPWTTKLEETLNQSRRSDLRAFVLPLNHRGSRCFKQVLSADIFIRVGFRPGAPTWRGRIFDATWSFLRMLNPDAVRVFYWLGTDVLNTTQDFKAGRLRQRSYAEARKDHHLADATWLVEELLEVGIGALPKTITIPELLVGDIPRLPSRFSVLSYVPDTRHSFYGGNCIYEAARQLPDIRFDVVGGSGAWVSKPLPNLVFHGWQQDMKNFHRNATVLVRLVQHDGTGLTALEALSFGRHVIYSYPLRYSIRVRWGDTDALVEKVRELFDLHKLGMLLPNASGSAYVQEHFNHQVCTEDLISYLLELSASQQARRLSHNGQ